MASNEDDETPQKRGVNDTPGNGAEDGENHGLSADDFQSFCNNFLGSNNSPSLNLLMGTPNLHNNNTPNNNNNLQASSSAGRMNMLTAAASTAPAVAPPPAVAAAGSLPVAEEQEEEEDDDDDEEENPAEEVVYATHQANATHNAAKRCVEFFMKDFSASAGKPGGKNTSWCWNHYQKARIIKGKEDELRDNDPSAFARIMVDNPNDYICTFCYNQHDTTLSSCFKKAYGSTSNPMKHFRDKHVDEVNDYYKKNAAVLAGFGIKSSQKEANEKKRSRSDSNEDKVKKQSVPIFIQKRSKSASTPHKLAPSPSTNASMIDYYAAFREEGKKKGKALVHDYHQNLVKWASDANIPARAICDNSQFDQLLMHALRNGPSLLAESRHLSLGFRKFTTIRKDEFDTMLNCIACSVAQARDYFKGLAHVKDGKGFRFINVGHDIWESAQRELLGLSIFFWNGATSQHNVWAIGLSRVQSHKAEDVRDASLSLLARCGVEQGDLYRPVNDTTSASLKAGRLLCLGSEGTCTMHTVSLALEHATGLKTRRRGRTTVDKFPAFVDQYKRAKDCFGWLMNTKAKSRFSKYEVFLQPHGRSALKVYLPNATRIAGIHRMYVSGLRSRWNLDLFLSVSPVGKTCPTILTNEDWKQIAEHEAVLMRLSELTQMVQTDRPGSISIAWLMCFLVYMDYVACESFLVAEVDENASWRDDESDKWNASAVLPNSQFRKAQSGSKHQVWFVPRSLPSLSSSTITLICRIRRDIMFYLCKPTKDQMIAMATDPLMATLGLQTLKFQMEVLAMAFEVERALTPSCDGEERPAMAGEQQAHTQHPSQAMPGISGEPESEEEKSWRHEKEDWLTNHDNFVRNLKENLKLEIMTQCSDYLEYTYPTSSNNEKKQPGDPKHNGASFSDTVKELSPAEILRLPYLQRLKYKAKLKEKQKQMETVKDNLQQPEITIDQLKSQHVDKQINRFFDEEVDWRQVLLNQQQPPVNKEELDELIQSSDDFKEHLPFLSSQFNALEWWQTHGRMQYPMIYLVACSILSLPESNGHQERVFSSCTWMDGKLQRRQNPATHEMKALLYRNRAMLANVMDKISKNKNRISKQAYDRVIKMHMEMSEKCNKLDKERVKQSKILGQNLLAAAEEEEGRGGVQQQQDEAEDAYDEAVSDNELEEAMEIEDDEDGHLISVVEGIHSPAKKKSTSEAATTQYSADAAADHQTATL
jgi:hypothetical protein